MDLFGEKRLKTLGYIGKNHKYCLSLWGETKNGEIDHYSYRIIRMGFTNDPPMVMGGAPTRDWCVKEALEAAQDFARRIQSTFEEA